MNRYCIWFVTPDDSVMRRAEVVLASTIHCHQILEQIEAQLAEDCGLTQAMVVDWKRFEDEPSPQRANLTTSRAA